MKRRPLLNRSLRLDTHQEDQHWIERRANQFIGIRIAPVLFTETFSPNRHLARSVLSWDQTPFNPFRDVVVTEGTGPPCGNSIESRSAMLRSGFGGIQSSPPGPVAFNTEPFKNTLSIVDQPLLFERIANPAGLSQSARPIEIAIQFDRTGKRAARKLSTPNHSIFFTNPVVQEDSIDLAELATCNSNLCFIELETTILRKSDRLRIEKCRHLSAPHTQAKCRRGLGQRLASNFAKNLRSHNVELAWHQATDAETRNTDQSADKQSTPNRYASDL